MATTVRINEEVKHQLKIQSAKLGVKQIDLVNRYVIEGIKRDTPKNPIKSIEEIEKLLSHDKPEGNNLKNFANLVDDEVIDPVEEKMSSYRGY